MSDQNPSFCQYFRQEISMSHLPTAAHHHYSTAIPPKAAAAATTGEKRPSHFSASEPSWKRADLTPPPSAAAGDGGYTTLPLPIAFPAATGSHLASTSSILKQPPQETSNAVQRAVSGPSPFKNLGTPPRPPPAITSRGSRGSYIIWRPLAAGTPPVERKSSGSLNCGESPNVKEESETVTENWPQEAVWIETTMKMAL